MNDERIAPARGSDVEGLLEMMEDFNAGEGIPWDAQAMESALHRLLGDGSLGFVLAATGAGGVLAGYAVVTFNYDLEFGGRDAFITELYVRPATRRIGLGRRLLAAAEARAQAEGVLALHLLVMPENAAALRLYERTGFVRSPRVMMTKTL